MVVSPFPSIKHGCLGYQAELFKNNQSVAFILHFFYCISMALPIPLERGMEFSCLLSIRFLKNPLFFLTTPKVLHGSPTLLQSHQNLPAKITKQRISDSERGQETLISWRSSRRETTFLSRNFPSQKAKKTVDSEELQANLFETFRKTPARWFNAWPIDTLVGGHESPFKGLLNHSKRSQRSVRHV